MIVLRAGCTSDSKTLATLILSSAPVLLPYLFGGKTQVLDYITNASQQTDGQYSAVRHQVASISNKPVGCITLWDNLLPQSFHASTVQSLTRFLSPQQISHLVSSDSLISKIFLAPTAQQICIGHLAVLEGKKSLGIGKQLISYAISKAKQNNKTELVLDVDSSNDEAMQFYSRQGFKLIQANEFQPTNQLFNRMQLAVPSTS